MARLEAIPALVVLAAQPDFIRESVIIVYGNPASDETSDYRYFSNEFPVGVELTSLANPVQMQHPFGTTLNSIQFPPETTLHFGDINAITNVATENQVNQTDGLRLVAKNGPVEIRVGTNTPLSLIHI